MNLLPLHFHPVFGEISPYLAGKINHYAFEHRAALNDEHDRAVLDMIRAAYHDELPVSGPARHPIWEKGWSENLAAFDPANAGLEIAKPRYHNKYPIVRWQGDLYVPKSEGYEYNMLAIIGDWAFDKYLRDARAVYEFGCGTGHNLFRVRDVNPNAYIKGLDWAESAVKFVNLQAEAGAYGNPALASGGRFDFFNPDPDLFVPPETAFLTVASLEQTGSQWRAFMEFVLAKKPAICIHIEPIEEVLDPAILLDHLSLQYFAKRGYLTGFLTGLQQLETQNRIKIHEVRRTKIGSKFIEGYSVVAWSPVVKA